MVDTPTVTRTLVFTREQISMICQWASNAWHDADRARMLTPPGSPQEAAAEADQLAISEVQEKLRGF